MALSFQRCLDDITHALGGPMHSGMEPARVVNEAGQYVVSMHPWKYLERSWQHADLRGKVTITDATWTESSLTLTDTGAFTSYSFLAGDQVQITDGTGATLDYYGVASRTSANAIVLKESIGSAADGQTDIDGTLWTGAVALPSDFGQLISVTPTEGLVNSVVMCSMVDIDTLRTNEVDVGQWTYFVAVSYGPATAPGGPPSPRLEVYPCPTANDPGGFTITYRAGWVPITSEGSAGTTEQMVPIPEWMEFEFRQLVRAMARGWEEDDVKPMAAWMADALPLFEKCKARDGAIQGNLGRPSGGVIQRNLARVGQWFAKTSVSNPA